MTSIFRGLMMKTFSVSMNMAQAKQLFNFCDKNKVKEFFFAKDQGAYFGATSGNSSEGNFENCILYVRGCDPQKNDDWWENASHRFGGDDFGEHFDCDLLKQFVTSAYKRITFKFNVNSISVSFNS